jgi:hypothetical protein
MILAAHLPADAAADVGDHLVGDVEAVGLVDAAEAVDRDQHETAGGAQLDRFVDGFFEHLDHVPAIHLAGQGVEPGQIGEPLLALVALVDDAHDAVSACRFPVGAGEPAPDILDPEQAVGSGPQRILQLVGNAGALVLRGRPHHRVGARLPALRIDQLRVAAPGAQRRRVGAGQDLADIRAPGQRVSVDPPFVGHLPDRGEDRAGVERDRHGRDRRHRLVHEAGSLPIDIAAAGGRLVLGGHDCPNPLFRNVRWCGAGK